MAALVTPRALLLTDPSVLGITSTGDVDDIAAILLLAQTYGENLTIVICDDANRLRFNGFKDKYGDDIQATYGCTLIKETDVGGNLLPDTTVFVHAPTTAATSTWLTAQMANINKIFTQGEESGRANFKNSPGMWALLNSPDVIGKTTFYRSNDTKFVINSQTVNLTDLHPKAKKALDDYYAFKRFARFGIPVGTTFLADMLYSDTGGPADYEGGPKTIGNGIKYNIPTILKLRGEGKMPAKDSAELIEQLGELDTALTNTYTGANPTTVSNIRDSLWLLDQYCDYKSYLVDGQLPNMSNFKAIPLRRVPCDPDVQRLFEPDESTPLFDAASAAFGLNLVPVPTDPADTSHHAPLREIIKQSLQSYSDKLKENDPVERQTKRQRVGGRKTRRRKRTKRRKGAR